jgi:hypothetical protein
MGWLYAVVHLLAKSSGSSGSCEERPFFCAGQCLYSLLGASSSSNFVRIVDHLSFPYAVSGCQGTSERCSRRKAGHCSYRQVPSYR